MVPTQVRQHSFLEIIQIDHEIFSYVILFLPRFKKGSCQLLAKECAQVQINHKMSIRFSGKNKKNISICCLLKTITKTYLYNFDPLKPHFYIVKLGFTGVYIIFLTSAQNIDCGYLLELPREAVLTSTHNLCFEQKYEKNIGLFI